MSTVNKFPTGLLGFFGIKNFGRAPQQLSENLVPIWDATKHYLGSYSEYLQSGGPINNAGILQFGPGVSATNGDMVYVHQASLRIAATTLNCEWYGCLSVTKFASVSPNVRVSEMGYAANTVTQKFWTLCVAKDIWLPPGDVMTIETFSITNPTATFEATVRFTRLTA